MPKTKTKSITKYRENQKWEKIGADYLKRGFSVVPIGSDKKPLFKWKKYQSQQASLDEIINWCKLPEFKGLALVTGKLSGVLVVDLDNGAELEGTELPKTVLAKTGNGYHFYFKYPDNTEIRNHTGIRKNVDIRGEGGYAIMPPSYHPSGKRYEWVYDLGTQISELPNWLIEELQKKKGSKVDWKSEQIISGVPESMRNDSAARVVGKMLAHIPPEDWESFAWVQIRNWNLQNQPPLSEWELRSVFDSIANKEARKRNKSVDEFQTRFIHGFKVKLEDPTKFKMEKGDFTYLLKPSKNKVDLTLICGETIVNRDSFSLVSSKSRATFVNASKLGSEQKDQLRKDLVLLSQVVDGLNREIIKGKSKEKKVELSEEEISIAKKLLKDETLLHKVLLAIKKLGVAGEEKTALLHYLVLTSRITDEPLSVLVKGESSVGKSYVVSQVLQLIPTEGYIDITDATAQSFFYAPKGHFAHKIIVIFEKHGGEKADYSIRTLQSEKKLKIQVTVKDPDTGQFTTKEHEVQGPAGFITTTTSASIHQENETRNLSIFPDESINQTKRTFEVTDSKYRAIPIVQEGHFKKWQNMQRALQAYLVVIPFVEEIRKKFPKKPIRVRRDYKKLLSIIAVVALLHQEQRDKEEIHDRIYVKASLADFHIAKVLLEETLQKTIYSLPPKSEQLIQAAKDHNADNELLPGITIRELAKAVDWDYDTAKKWFDPAFQKGYFVKVEEHKGSKAAVYKVSDKELESDLILPQTEDLYEMNPEWLGGHIIYDPIEGTVYDFKGITTDEPMESEDQ